MKIYVIRHAQTRYRLNNIFTSKRRTKHVTEIININNIPVIYDERIIERELGKYETYNYKDIKEKYPDKKILLVTHGGVTRGIYCNAYGIPEDGDLSLLNQKNCELKECEV